MVFKATKALMEAGLATFVIDDLDRNYSRSHHEYGI